MAVTPVDVGGSIAKGLQIRQFRDQQEAQEAERAKRKTLADLQQRYFSQQQAPAPQGPTMQGPPIESPKMGRQEFLNKTASVDRQAGIDWQEYLSSMDDAERGRQEAEAPYMVAALENVRDQAGYDQAKGYLEQQGVDVSDMPPEYNPGLTNMVVQGSRFVAGIKPEASKAKAAILQEYDVARGQGYGGSLLDFQRERAAATRAPEKPKERPAYTDVGKAQADFRNGHITAEQLEAETMKVKAEDAPDTFKNADKLRDEFAAQSKDFVKARDAYARVLASAEDPSAAGDMALIFNYMKVLDPGSVVRESEFALAAESGTYGQRIQGAVNRVMNGERLADGVRNDFVDRAGKLYQKQEGLHVQLRDQYTALSERFQIPPDQVVTEMRGEFDSREAGGPPTITGDDEYNALPSGAEFIGPDGVLRKKP